MYHYVLNGSERNDMGGKYHVPLEALYAALNHILFINLTQE